MVAHTLRQRPNQEAVWLPDRHSRILRLWQQIVSVIEALWGTGPIIAVQEFFGPGWGWLFHGLSFLGTVYAATVVISLALWLSGRRLAYGMLGAVLLAAATDALLWAVIGVPRPDDPRIVVRADLGVSSFPSGHTVVRRYAHLLEYGVLIALAAVLCYVWNRWSDRSG